MANRGRPEKLRRAETDKSVFALEDSFDEIWLQAQQAIEAMKVLPNLKTHRLDLRLGDKRVKLFPDKHPIPLPDGTVAGVKWEEGLGWWNLVELNKIRGDERFVIQAQGYGALSVVIKPIDTDRQYWLPSVRQFQNGLARLDEKFLPFGEAVDTEQLGGVFELGLDNHELTFYAIYTGGELFDPIHYQLSLERSDPACRHLCEPMVRLLAQVFGKS